MIQRTLRDRVLARSLTVIALLFLNAPASAESIKQTIKIGVLTDMSGVFSDYFGEGSVIAAKLAIEDAGLTLGEAPIELVVADHQNKPDVGTAIARRWFDVDGVNAIVDVPTSSVALAVSSLARQKNKVFMPSSAFTAELTGRSCSPNTVQWTIDNWALANSVGRAVAEAGGRTWYFITADFAFGHDLERVATAAVIKAGGKVLGATRLPLGTTDFASALLKAQSSKADVIAIANAGPDLTNTIKQASEFGLNAGPQKIVGLALIINNVKALGIVGTTGMLAATPFYWDMNEKTACLGATISNTSS